MATLQVKKIGEGTVTVNDPNAPTEGRTAELVITPAPGWKLSDVLVETVDPVRTGCCFAVNDEGAPKYPYRQSDQCLQGPADNISVGNTGYIFDFIPEGTRIIYDIVYTCDSGTCVEQASVDPASVRYEIGDCTQFFEDQS